MESSMADKMKAERQCQEAQTKLNVLSAYFKDKELQLQKYSNIAKTPASPMVTGVL